MRRYMLACVVPWLAALAGCGASNGELLLQGTTMGSAWTVKIAGPVRVDQRVLHAGIQAQFDAVDRALSTYRRDSALSRFNAAPHADWQPLDRELVTVLQLALTLSLLSDGAYDVTVAPLVDLWGFGPAPARDAPPDERAVEAARVRVGWRLIELDAEHQRARRPPGVMVDLSSLGKGRGVDRVADWLEAQGVHGYLIDLSGKLRASGFNGRGRLWQVGVELPGADDPQGDSHSVAVMHLSVEAVATAGDYRRYFERDGRRYSHLIDPRSGYPVDHGTTSATVRAPNCLTADAWATLLMVMRPERALSLAEAHGLAALLLVREQKGLDIRATRNWHGLTLPPAPALQTSHRRKSHEA
jgi:FAD:protein FMN transferase